MNAIAAAKVAAVVSLSIVAAAVGVDTLAPAIAADEYFVAVAVVVVSFSLGVHAFWLLQPVVPNAFALVWRWAFCKHYDFVICGAQIYLEMHCYLQNSY